MVPPFMRSGSPSIDRTSSMLMSFASFFQFGNDFQPSPGVAAAPANPGPGEAAVQMLPSRSTSTDAFFRAPARSPNATIKPTASSATRAKSTVCGFVFKVRGTSRADSTPARQALRSFDMRQYCRGLHAAQCALLIAPYGASVVTWNNSTAPFPSPPP